MNADAKASDVGAALVSALVSVLVFGRVRGIGLIGWDSLPEIASSRIAGVSDFLATFVERTAEGYYPYKFYRPVFNLSLALDYAIWGVNPIGYQLSSAILFGLCGFALYRLARALLGVGARAPGPWITLALFFAAPFNLEIVAIVSRRMDVIAGLLICLAMTSQLRRCRAPMPRGAMVPALFTLGAIGAKEIAVIVPPLVFLLVLLYARPAAGRLPWRRASLAVVPHVAAIALCVGARLAAFGELGGHPTTRLAGAFDRLPWMVGQEVAAQFGDAIAGGDGLHLLIGIGTLVAAALLGAWLVLGERTLLTQQAENAVATGTVAIAWLVGSAAVLGTVGFVQPWYLLVARQGLALLAGAMGTLLAGAVARGRRAPVRLVAAVGLAVLAVVTLAQAVQSPFLGKPHRLLEATRLADEYFATLRTRIDSAPDASIVGYGPPPALVRLPDDAPGVPAMTVATSYTIQAWADLEYPERQLVVVPRGPMARPAEVKPTTTVIELHRRYARLSSSSQSRKSPLGDGVQRPAGADPASIKAAIKQMQQAIQKSSKNQRRIVDWRAALVGMP